MSSKSKVLLVGMGGVGTIGAYGLEYGGKAEVTAVVRSDYKRMSEHGFDIESCDYGSIKGFKPSHVENSVESAMEKHGPFEFIVFTMKNIPDIQPLEPMIAKCYNKGTTIVLLQNGFGIERSILKEFPEATVLSGVTMISSFITNGKVNHILHDSIKCGVCYNNDTPKEEQIATCKKFIEVYSTDKNDIIFDADVKYTRLSKLIYNAAINTTSALTGVDLGRLELFGGTDSIVRPAMKEVIAIAKADGVELPVSIMDYMIRVNDGDWYPPSMLLDIRKGNYTEYQVIVGNALEIAKEYKVETPVLNVLYNLLHVVQLRTMEKKGKIVLPQKRPYPADNFKLEYQF